MVGRDPKPVELGQRWSEADDRIIYAGFLMGQTYKALGLKCGRSVAGVRKRLMRLGLIDDTGRRVIEPPDFEASQAQRRVRQDKKRSPAYEDNRS
ncbi:MAG: hypothetical protein PHT60_13900 [Acidiphilium sp.]|nr:hypothetical protein [Acidiphilium sp.]MDD4936858.1 hypothetical protein [Acidiphilium sp.]